MHTPLKGPRLNGMKINWPSIAHAISNYIAIHLFLTLVSMPIIIAWGLPFSALSLIGNLIFSPLLSFFLLICSLAFFAELFWLPHGLLNWLIEKLSHIWQWLLAIPPDHGLFGLYAPAWWLLLGLAIGAILLIRHPLLQTAHRRLFALSILFTLTIIGLKAAAPQEYISEIPCNNGHVTLICRNGKTILIDPGVIGSRISAQSWIRYTFMPKLIAQTGSLTIDQCIALKPSILSFDALATLCQDANIKELHIPYLEGTLEGSFKRSFNKLYAIAKKGGSVISRLHNQDRPILCNKEQVGMLCYRGKKQYQTITYPQFSYEKNF